LKKKLRLTKGEKGKGGMATTGMGGYCGRDLGVGWKISPSIKINAGEDHGNGKG